MKIPRYWACRTIGVTLPNGRERPLSCWEWSERDVAEAGARADARIAAMAQRLRGGQPLQRYGYSDRPLREEILETIATRSGGEAAVITRNQYGARVLNASGALFIDIDLDETQPESGGLAGALGRLFGAKPVDPIAAQLERLSAWARRNPFLGLRVYRTAGGLRAVIPNEVFDPQRADALEILQTLSNDPLYIRLCQAQGCFRARLTPKPWRCAMPNPPARFPWPDSAGESRYRAWERRYEHAAAGYRVCRPVAHYGPRDVHPDLVEVLAYHDRFTLASTERPLA